MAKKDDREDSVTKRRLELGASLIGAVLALGTIGIIAWDGLSMRDTPPFVSVAPGAVQQIDGGYVLAVVASNRGGRTAAQVIVEGALSDGGALVARSETTFDYVPGRSSREGGLFFAQDPRAGNLRLRALGYVDP